MKTKNIEEAINRIKDFKNLLVEIGLNVTLKHEDKEITLKRSDLILALEHIEEQGKEIEKQKAINTFINHENLEDKYEEVLEKVMTKFLNNNIDNAFIPKQVIRDKILEREFELQQEYEDFKDDIRLNTLQEIYYLNEEEK